jgi:hypothetical protein
MRQLDFVPGQKVLYWQSAKQQLEEALQIPETQDKFLPRVRILSSRKQPPKWTRATARQEVCSV